MATNEDELIISIGADFSSLQKNLKKAIGQVDKLGDESAKTGRKADKAFKKMSSAASTLATGMKGAAVAITAGAVALAAFSSKTADSTREMIKWADRLDISKEKFSQLVGMGKRVGAELDSVGDAVKDLNERIADAAAGNKNFEDQFRKIGLSSRELLKLPIEEQFIKVGAAIGMMTNAADRNLVSQELMAEAGFHMLPAFKAGEKGMRDMMKASVELGDALTAKEVKRFQELEVAMNQLAVEAAAAGQAIGTEFIPVIKWLSTDGISWVKDAVDWYKTYFEAIRKGTEESILSLNKHREALEKLAEAERESAGSGGLFSGSVKQSSLGGDDAPMSTPSLFDGATEKQAEEILQIVEDRENMIRKAEETAREGRESLPIFMKTEEELALEKQLMQETWDWLTNGQQNSLNMELEAKNKQLSEMKRMEDDFIKGRMKADKLAQAKRAALWKSGLVGKLEVTKQELGFLSNLMNSENRKMFEAGKAASIANAVIDTISAVSGTMASYSSMGPWGTAAGAVVSAAHIAAGAARVQQIQGTQMGSGVSGSPAVGPNSSTAGSIDTGQAGPVGEAAQTTNFDINIQGESISTEQLRTLFQQINEGTDDGLTLKVN